MFNFKSDFLEAYDILSEDTPKFDRQKADAAKRFWQAAKEGKIDDEAFRTAYNDELKELNLASCIDFYCRYYRKGDYGKVKKAAEDHPDSWAVKALLRIWGLQFKDGVIPNSVIENEERAKLYAENEKREKEEQEKERIRRAEVKETNKKLYNDLRQKVEALIEELTEAGKAHITNQQVEISAILDKAIQYKKDITVLTKNIVQIYNESEEIQKARVNKRPFEINLYAYHQVEWQVEPAKFLVKAEDIFGELRSDYKIGDITEEFLEKYSVDDIKQRFLSYLDSIYDQAVDNANRAVDKRKQEYEEVLAKVNEAKAVQNAVNSGKPSDDTFTSKILDILIKGGKKADKEYDYWSKNATDGSDGASYHYEKFEAIRAAAIYLAYCNWQASIEDEEIASWNQADSIDNLYDELSEVFEKGKHSTVQLEIIK